MKVKRGQKPKSAIARIDEEINQLRQQYDSIKCDKESVKRFSDFPISQKTLRGMSDAKFLHPTEIQRESIGPALQGKDVLGAAITGSGKTLAFLIPVIEHLFVNKWARTDGIGAIIISPTRELAYQIFETLKKVGCYHDFSAGLIIGGKNLKFERSRMDQCNILICTPGRLLQHMDENPLFNANTMEMLVLDEADRCLDMGFEQTLNAIIENFPPNRQTLLFSATQTNSVKDLARLNLNNPVYIGHKEEVVPDLLQQNYVVMAQEDKTTMLWSFIKNHLKQKIIVFLSSCKQVKYVYEIFCKLRPGTSLLALYGTLHQDRRIAIYNDFVKKSNVVLFATDIASRGLDFPAVNWVVQLDCPEDVTQYIHRAGRSARNKARGESLLVLTPSEEEAMVEELSKQKIQVRKIQIDPKKLFSPRIKMEAALAQSTDLKASAQRAFISYIKSVFLMKNKRVFNVLSLNLDAYANSLGLAVTPRVRFLERHLKKRNAPANALNDGDAVSAGLVNGFAAAESDSDDDFIKVKRIDHEIQGDAQEKDEAPLLLMPKKEKLVTKASLAKKALKKKIQVNERLRFDTEGNEIVDERKSKQSALAREYEERQDQSGGIDISLAKQVLNEEDKYDKQRFRELVKQRHKKQKEKYKTRADDGVASGSENGSEGENDYYSEDNEESDDNSVDLSWLPDPDKVYNNDRTYRGREVANTDDSSSDSDAHAASDDDDDDVEEDDMVGPAKKKMKVTSKLSLTDAETIAAQLLANSN